MSNGEEPGDSGDEPDDAAASEGDVPAESLESRLDEAEAALEAAETEADLDDVEATLDAIEADLEAASLAGDEDDGEDGDGDGDGDDRGEALATRLSDLREALEAERGPYAADVADVVDEAHSTLTESDWTDAGRSAALEAVESFLGDVDESLEAPVEPAPGDLEAHAEALSSAAETIRGADLDPDGDAETVETLLAAAEQLAADLDAAETWEDLTIRETLQAKGFYDRLTPENRKDFPPELSVVRIAEAENDVERVLQALEYFESNFMEDNVLDALRRMGPAAAYDAMIERAEKRDQPAIRVLGKIGDERAVETLVEFIRDESNAPLQKVTLRALGEIGSEDATQAVADRLVAEDPDVRSHAARALGLIGDPRAIDPLSARLDAEDEPDGVRAAAAWALVQIGTEDALDAAAAHTDDRAYLVQAEAEKARDATA